MDMPSEALKPGPSGQGWCIRKASSQHLLSRQERSLEHGAVVLCLLICFVLRVQVLGLFQTSGAGQKVSREVLARKKLFLSSPVV